MILGNAGLYWGCCTQEYGYAVSYAGFTRSHRVTLGYTGLTGLQSIKLELHKATQVYKRLHRITQGYTGFHGATQVA